MKWTVLIVPASMSVSSLIPNLSLWRPRVPSRGCAMRGAVRGAGGEFEESRGNQFGDGGRVRSASRECLRARGRYARG